MQGLFGEGGVDQVGPGCPAQRSLEEAEACPGAVTPEERAAILSMLRKRVGSAPSRVRGGRASALAWAALKLAAVVMVVAGVGNCLGDGGEFDDGGVSVAQKPGGGLHGANRGQAGRREEGKLPGSAVGSDGGSDGGRFVLRKGLGGWRLVYDGRESVLPDEKGVGYVAALLLDPPSEPIHASELANRAFGEAIVEGQRNLGLDDQETVRALRDARQRCQAIIDDNGATEVERQEARAELESIDEWARKHLRGTEGNEQRQVRAVRQAIRRLMASLGSSRDPVLKDFGEHLERYLWGPSCAGSAATRGRVRAGLAGRFTYEPPEGVRWRR